MANVMNLADLKNHASRNGFDLSSKNAFTAKVGELLPIGVIHTLPGDKIDINLANFTRTMPVNTAAYTRIREYVDAYFVPYRLLWNKFNTFSTNMTNNEQHAASLIAASEIPEQHPYFTVKDVCDYLYNMRNETNAFGYNRATLSAKLLSYMDYGDYKDHTGERAVPWEQSPRHNFDLNPFALLAYQKIYQDHFRHQQWETSSPWTYNLDYMTSEDSHMTISQLSLPVANKKSNLMDLRYCNWEKDYFFGVLPDSQYGEESVVPLKNIATKRITDDGHYIESTTPSLAGQNVTTTAQISGGSSTYLYKLGSAQSGVSPFKLSIPEGMVNQINGYINDLSILRLRQAEFMQKWKEIAQSGDQDFKTQLEKFWNVKVPQVLSNLSTHLGGSVSNIDISEVVNTNITGANAADIAGQGRGSGNGHISFDAQNFGNEHGVIIIMYHARPLLDYATDGISRFNLKTRYADYANPSFDKLGMQETYMAEIDNSAAVFNAGLPKESNFIGYAPRYAEYKTSVDRIHGGFVTDENLKTWVAPITSAYFEKWLIDMKIPGTPISFNLFKVNPNVLDSIFAVNATENYDTEQLLVNAAFDIKAVRNLDYNGLPY